MSPRIVRMGEVPVNLQPMTEEPWGWDRSRFWCQPVLDKAYDMGRTEELHSRYGDSPVEHTAGNRPDAQTPTWGLPWQDVSGVPHTKVWDIAQYGWFPWPWVNGWVYLPLPELVRREGDPHGASDAKWWGWDPVRGRLFEALQLQPPSWSNLNRWTVGYQGVARGVSIWDTNRVWNASGQPRGQCAAQLPYLPLIPRYEEVEAGIIAHAIPASFPNYAPGREGLAGPARGSDGEWPGHPIRAGERLRLKESVANRLLDGPLTVAERALVWGLMVYGIINVDKWTKADPAGQAVKVHFSQDARWYSGVRRTLTKLSDYEVVYL